MPFASMGSPFIKEEKKKYSFNLTEKDQNGENIQVKFIKHRTISEAPSKKKSINHHIDIILFVLHKALEQWQINKRKAAQVSQSVPYSCVEWIFGEKLIRHDERQLVLKNFV